MFVNENAGFNRSPLTFNEVINCFKERWGVSYDLKLIVRKNSIYLQIMWAYLEQQSFPLDEVSYKANLNKTLEIVNRVGQAKLLRVWLQNVEGKPRLGTALTLSLEVDDRLDEFILGNLK